MHKHSADPVGGELPQRRRHAADPTPSPSRGSRAARRSTEAPRPLRHVAAEGAVVAPRRGRRRSLSPRARLVAGLAAATAALPLSLHLASAAVDSGVVAQDGFARTVARGWGDADVGGTWSTSQPDLASVSGGRGRIAARPGSSVTALLHGVAVADVDASVAIAPDARPGGNGLYSSLLLRRQDDRASYRVQARIVPSGELRLSILRVRNGVAQVLAGEVGTGIVPTPGAPAVLEGDVRGTSPVVVRARAAANGSQGHWLLSASDASGARIAAPGAVGLITYLSSSSRALGVGFSGLHAGETVAARPAPVPSASSPAPVPSPSASPSASPHSPAPSSAPASPAPTPPQTAPAPGGRPATTAGARAPGAVSYPVPSGAVVVSPNGSDTASGTVGAPLRTVARAVATAPSGSTLVLRGGTYHENVNVPASKRLTIQPYPGEAVWFDGSSSVAGWSPAGSGWVHDGWTARFDSTPCFNAGSCATNNPNFQFVSSSAPMAAHPDQVFVDGVAQRQVGSAGALTAGTFYVDTAAQRLYLGSDPRGHAVAASDLSEAMTLGSSGSVVRGLGVRRYGTALPRMGTIRLTAPHVTLEDVTVLDNATTGIFLASTDATLHRVTSSRNGMLGVGGNTADRSVVSGLRAEANNTEHFKMSPVSGGIKVASSRDLTIRDSYFGHNEGPGIWFDSSVDGATVIRSDVIGNAGHGVSFEISARGVFADDVVRDNGQDGFKINNSEDVQVWASTIIGNARTIEVVQDPRDGANPSEPGHDHRRPVPDPTMTWQAGRVSIGDSVLGAARSSANCVLCVEDYTQRRSAAQMGVTEDADLFVRTSGPRWLVVWSAGKGNPAVFTSLAAYRSASGQGAHSVESDSAANVGAVAPRPLPPAVAALLGVSRVPAVGARG